MATAGRYAAHDWSATRQMNRPRALVPARLRPSPLSSAACAWPACRWSSSELFSPRPPAEPLSTWLAAVLPCHAPLRVAGIDDWSWRRGTRYGTVVVDLERRAVVDVLSDRSRVTMAAWLRDHPSVDVVSRDHCGLYAQAARQGVAGAAGRRPLPSGAEPAVGDRAATEPRTPAAETRRQATLDGVEASTHLTAGEPRPRRGPSPSRLAGPFR